MPASLFTSHICPQLTHVLLMSSLVSSDLTDRHVWNTNQSICKTGQVFARCLSRDLQTVQRTRIRARRAVTNTSGQP